VYCDQCGSTIVANVAFANIVLRVIILLLSFVPRGPLCWICLLLHAILEFRCQRQTHRKRVLYFTHVAEKFYSLEAEPSPRGLYFRAWGAWHLNMTKLPLIYSVSYFNLGGLELCLGGLSPPNSPVATGMAGAS